MEAEKDNQRSAFFDVVSKALNVPELVPDEFDACSFLVDEKVRIHLQREEGGTCMVHAVVDVLPLEERTNELLSKLLEANLFWFWGDSDAATLSFDAASGTVFLAQRFSAEDISIGTLEKNLDNFVGLVEFWFRKIEEYRNA